MVIVHGFERMFLWPEESLTQGRDLVCPTMCGRRRFLRLCLFIIISLIEQRHLFRHKILPRRTA